MSTWLGIDFSGDQTKWSGGCRRSNVWIARVESAGDKYRLQDLRTVRDLPGNDAPFDRLLTLLKAGAYDAAGIDAPFSLSATYVPGGHVTLLDTVGVCPLDGRPFPSAASLLATVAVARNTPYCRSPLSIR